ncbi:MAG: FG-GAP-like repeat-containing protein [Rhodothermales bacterium]
MHQRKQNLFTLLCLLVVTLLATDVQAQIAFSDVSVAAGVGGDTYDSTSRHGLGVNWVDYDNDGYPDLFLANGGGEVPHLYRNETNGTFSNKDALLPALPVVEMTGSVFADYDNDGDMDIYITVGGNDLFVADGKANFLLKNMWVENGNAVSTPLFQEVAAAAGVDNLAPVPFGANGGYKSYTAAWLDYDVDSCIDLFVGNMVWDAGGTDQNRNALYKNNCDGTFTNVTTTAGIFTGSADQDRPTLAVFGGLMDGDIYPDLYVVNVHDASPYHHDQYFHNNGDGTFTELTGTMAGIGDDSGAGMGIDLADIDHDGDWDIYMSDLLNPGGVEPVAEGNTLYLGNPGGTWSENSAPAAGVASGDSWAVSFIDADNNGFEDLLVGVIAPTPMHDMLFQNNGNGTFSDISVAAGMISGDSRGSAVADYDRDGDEDFAIVNLNGTLRLYQNVSTGTGNQLSIDLEATVSNRAAIGTLVEVTAGGTTYRRQVQGGVSSHSQDELTLHFGLGSATTVDEVKVSWPSGIVQTLTGVGTNQTIAITETPSATGLFTEVGSAAGVAFLHDGDSVADMGMGTGAAWFDYDNDGDLDLYVTQRTGANKLFQNNGGSFVNVAVAAGAADAGHDGAGVAVADYNNDGCRDLFLANGDGDVLLKNNCNGTFSDVTAGSGLEASEERRGTTASWGDYDGDGFVDLYVANHMAIGGNTVTGATEQIKAQDYIFHNNGNGTFTDVSDMLMGTARQGMGFGGGWTDFDNDGDLDVFVVHDCPFDFTAPQLMFRNDGGTNGATSWTFTEVSAAIGTDYCQNGMGLATGDYDRDGDMDYFLSDNGGNGTVPVGQVGIAGSMLLRNDGGSFSDQSTIAGVNSREWSWGANFLDYNLDGWQDLYLAAGAMNSFDPTPGSLWMNDGDGTFTDVSALSGGLNDDARTRTSVYGDYDGDGDLDMFLVNYAGTTKLFRNDNNNGNNYLVIDLVGVVSNRDGIGAKIEINTPDGGTQYYETRSGSSLGGGDDLGAYFGIGTNGTVSNVTITWPSGIVQALAGVAANQRLTVVEEIPASGDLFTDVSTATGVGFQHDGNLIAADMGMGTGAAWLDFDNDGDQDLYITTRASANRLFRNDNGTFTDVAAAAGVASMEDGAGVAAADYNNDGCIDIFLANSYADQLYHNNCDGTFTDVTAGSGLTVSEERRGTTASWADYDDDGYLDLFVANHMAVSDAVFTGAQATNYVFHNDGGTGSFTDVSAMVLGAEQVGATFVGRWTDFDNDGDSDLFLVHDCPFLSTGPQVMLRNDGGTNGVSNWTFTDVSTSVGANWCQNAMGISVGDYDHNGYLDLFFTDNGNTPGGTDPERAGAVLLKNTGGNFTDNTVAAGVANTEFSWGSSFFDFNKDGWLDLWMAGGALNDAQVLVPSYLWQNDGDGTFTDVSSTSGGLETSERSRTSAVADYDGDGDLDIAIVNYGGQVQLFRNDYQGINNYLIVDLEGVTSNRFGIGARVKATTNSGVQVFETNAGTSLGATDAPYAYFGLGSNTLVSTLEITWPSGSVQTLSGVSVNQRLTVTEQNTGGNNPPTASFTTTVNGLTVDFDASASSDSDGSIVSYAWDFGDGNTDSGVTTSHTYAASGTYTVQLTVTDNLGATAAASQSVSVSDGAGTGAFLESGGMVVMEAENFDANTPRGAHSWVSSTTFAGFSGAGAMRSDPDIGTQYKSNPEAVSPELGHNVLFNTTGDYYVWARIYAPDSKSRSVHMGYDGTVPSNVNGASTGTYGQWIWVDFVKNGIRETFNIATPGVHDINTWMREDGLLIDKMVLTTDVNFTPTGVGPSESPRDGGSGNPSPIASFTATQVPGTLQVDFDASASTDNGSIVSYAWDFGDGNVDTGVTVSHTYAVDGTYSVQLTVTDDEGATGAITKSVTVNPISSGNAFVEAGGMVVMEAENAHDNIVRGANSWVTATANAGFSGASYMLSDPDIGSKITSNVEASSSELVFNVDFTTTGNYYLWGRVWAFDSKGRTVHMGIDGAIPSNVNGLATSTYGQWLWVDLVKNGLRQTFNVATPGVHEINTWIREDGLSIDKIVMTTDPNFTPTGTGPAESPNVAPVISGSGVVRDGGNALGDLGETLVQSNLPTEFALEGNFPNPFNPVTTIGFALPEASDVRLVVYDMMGREVTTLIDTNLGAGRYQARWEGKNDMGHTVASGVYILRMTAGNFSQVHQMVFMK